MDVANFELCQELYELSGWLTGVDGNCYVSLTGETGGFEVRPLTDTGNDGIQICPAYDLGYLLRRLPVGNVLTSFEDKWMASSSPKVTTAAIPEDAAAKLAIELFKQGILSRGGDKARSFTRAARPRLASSDGNCPDCAGPHGRHQAWASIMACAAATVPAFPSTPMRQPPGRSTVPTTLRIGASRD